MLLRCPYCKSIINISEDRQRKSKKIRCPKCKKLMALKQPRGELRESKTVIESKGKILSQSLPENLSIYLEVIEGKDKGKKITLMKANSIFGRRDGDFNLNDPNISKKHMAIEVWSRDNIYIRDLSSTNGTYLNGVLILSSKLKQGDIIQIGSTKLKVSITTKPSQ